MNSTYMEIRRGRTVQLLALAWGLYAISFSLPAFDMFGTVEGWAAFPLVPGTALAPGTLSWVYVGYVVSLESFFRGHYVAAYIWLGSMATLAAVLFHYGRTSKAGVTS